MERNKQIRVGKIQDFSSIQNLLKLRETRAPRFPRAVGTCPWMPLDMKFKSMRVVISPISSGISPCRTLRANCSGDYS